MSDKTKSAHEIHLGNILVTIWKNDDKNGPFYTASFRRRYKQGEQWQYSDNFGEDDLLLLAKLLDQAHTWAVDQLRARGYNPSDEPLAHIALLGWEHISLPGNCVWPSLQHDKKGISPASRDGVTLPLR